MADDHVMHSSSGAVGPLRSDSGACDGHVDYWGAVDLWDDHKLHNVLP